ncbi:MAG: YgiT-type zinc finger protein [Candidatus Hydrogenedentes bacterium]|nr:YgiT-type zinc finger protein [Candidatus Hydrogenedentota bacterium]
MVTIRKCPACGSKKIKHVRGRWRGDYAGEKYTVPNLDYYRCPDCHERVYPPEAMRKIQAHSPAYSKRLAIR